MHSLSNISTREWTDDDVDAVRSLVWEAYLFNYTSFVPRDDLKVYYDVNYSRESLLKQRYADGVQCTVAVVDGEVVGFAKTHYESDKNRLFIASLYVHPHCQNAGIGRILMDKCRELARNHHHLSSIWLGVMVPNTRARLWYEKLGFKLTRDEDKIMGHTVIQHMNGVLEL